MVQIITKARISDDRRVLIKDIAMSARHTPAAWSAELKTTLILAWPLIITQLAQIGFYTTDVVMMGWLGTPYLAAGSLATSLMHPLTIGGIGVILATSPMVSQAIGSRDLKSIRRTVRQGFWVASIVGAIAVLVAYQAEPIFTFLGQNPETTARTSDYIYYAAWSIPPVLLYNVLRNFISAKGRTGVVLAITLAALVLNGVMNYVLMFGHLGFPRLELRGAGIATVLANLLMFAVALLYAVTHRQFKRHYILVRFFKPDWPRFFEFWRIGLPIGLTLVSEIGLFAGAVILMGWLGEAEVAAHAIALQCAAISFMIPLGLSQATTIRVGLMQGRKNPDGVAVAGWSAFVLTMVFMTITLMLFVLTPRTFVHVFLDPGDPANQVTIGLAAQFLVVAGLFQIFDGAQVAAAASLRGLSDTRMPMIMALFGYWLVGLPFAYWAGFVWGWGGVGVWTGLAVGLAFVGALLVARWAVRDRLGLVTQPMGAGQVQ